jgi:hypothetical protein
MFGKKLWATVSLLVIVAMLVSCAPEVIKETVVVTQVVEKVVTEIIEKTVKETIIVEGTPQVVEKVVTQVVEKEVTVIVTPTPPKVTLKLATWAGVDEANELQDILDRLNAASDTYEIVQESSPSEYWTKLQTTIAAVLDQAPDNHRRRHGGRSDVGRPGPPARLCSEGRTAGPH